MIRVIIAAVAAFAVMLVGFSFLMGVSKMDVSIKHQMQRHVVAAPFEPGDVVEISPDGLMLQGLLCPLDLTEEKKRNTKISANYYNVVDESKERFVEFVRDAKEAFNLPVSTPATARLETHAIPFVGEVSFVVGSIDSMLPESCICDIAESVIEKRNKACIVSRSLVETQLVTSPAGPDFIRKTVGVQFRPDGYTFNDLDALKQQCPDLNVSGRPQGPYTCDGQSGFSFDAVARSKIGLIRERTMTVAASGN